MFKLIRLEWKKNNVVIWELPMTLKRVFLMRRRETVRFLHQLSCLQAWLF